MEMKEINLPPFYVGQIVIAVKNTKCLKADNRYTVSKIRKTCDCYWDVSVGFIDEISLYCRCSTCGSNHIPNEGHIWHRHSLFAPIEENFKSISLSEVLEIETPLISAQ